MESNMEKGAGEVQMKLIISSAANKELFGPNGAYPFWVETRSIPVKLIREYSTYVIFEVLPHICKNPMAFGPSKSYTVTIDKCMIDNDLVRVENDKFL